MMAFRFWPLPTIRSKPLFFAGGGGGVGAKIHWPQVHQRKLEAARELYGLSATDNVDETDLKAKAKGSSASGGVNAADYGLGYGGLGLEMYCKGLDAGVRYLYYIMYNDMHLHMCESGLRHENTNKRMLQEKQRQFPKGP